MQRNATFYVQNLSLHCTFDIFPTLKWALASFPVDNKELPFDEEVTRECWQTELKFGLKETNPVWEEPYPLTGALNIINTSPDQESELNALEKWACDVKPEARTGKWEIRVCFPFGYTTKEREYFKKPPSSVFWDSFRLLANEHGGIDPPLCFTGQVCIMSSLISALALPMTPPHCPEWIRIYLIYPYSVQ